MDPTHPAGPAPDEMERVPIFGTWRAIYIGVIVTTVLTIALIAVFQRWPY
jgi:hypothetical protein